MKRASKKEWLMVAAMAAAAVSVPVQGDAGKPDRRFFPTGSVIFFHPDGTGANHW